MGARQEDSAPPSPHPSALGAGVCADSPVNSSLIPTGLTTPWTAFNGSAPLGGTTASPRYYDDEFKATASVEQCPQLETRVHDLVSGDTAVLQQDARFRFVQVYSGNKRVWP